MRQLRVVSMTKPLDLLLGTPPFLRTPVVTLPPSLGPIQFIPLLKCTTLASARNCLSTSKLAWPKYPKQDRTRREWVYRKGRQKVLTVWYPVGLLCVSPGHSPFPAPLHSLSIFKVLLGTSFGCVGFGLLLLLRDDGLHQPHWTKMRMPWSGTCNLNDY